MSDKMKVCAIVQRILNRNDTKVSLYHIQIDRQIDRQIQRDNYIYIYIQFIMSNKPN